MFQTRVDWVDALFDRLTHGVTARADYGAIMRYGWLALCCLGSGLIVALLSSRRCLWLDELYMLTTVQRPFLEGLLQQEDYSAPLYQFVLRLLMPAHPASEWTLRFPAFAFGILGIISTWWLANRLFDRRVAALSAFILAFNPLFLHHAAEGRPYTMFLFFSVLSFGAFHMYLVRGGLACGALYVAATVLLVYSHYFGLLALPAQAALLLVRRSFRPGASTSRVLAAFSAAGFLSVPAIWLMSRYVASGLPGLAFLRRTPPVDLLSLNMMTSLFADRTLGVVGLWATGVTVLGVVVWLKRKARLTSATGGTGETSWSACFLSPLLCLFWIAASGYALVVVSCLITPLFLSRYALPVIVPLALLLSAVAVRMPWQAQLLILALLIAGVTPRIRRDLREERRDYAELAARMDSSNDEHRRVYIADWPCCEGYVEPVSSGLRFYGYDVPNAALLRLSRQHETFSFEVQDWRRLEGDEACFIVARLQQFEDAVDICLNELARHYTKEHYGSLTLFKVSAPTM